MSEFNSRRFINKSRKKYSCVCCEQEIPIGSSYIRFVGKWEGEFQNWAMCDFCDDYRNEFSPDWSDGITPLWDELQESGQLDSKCKLCDSDDLEYDYSTHKDELEISCNCEDCDYQEIVSLRKYLGMEDKECN